jgi:hypothetical protein
MYKNNFQINRFWLLNPLIKNLKACVCNNTFFGMYKYGGGVGVGAKKYHVNKFG